MSDLQCAARFVMVCAPDAATAESLRHARIAAVYDGPPGSGAVALGQALGLPVQAMARPMAAADVLARAEEAVADLRDLADLHRGETVVVAVLGQPGQRVDVALDGDGLTVEEVSPGGAT